MTSKTERRNRPALSLHVPEPDARPGDAVDFSAVVIPAAGRAPLPAAGMTPALKSTASPGRASGSGT